MKSFTLTLLLFFLVSYASAQDANTRLFLKAGASIPTGEVGSKRLTSSSGFANVGRSVGAKILYPISKGLDLSAGLSNNSYTINRDAFDDYAVRTTQSQIRASGGIITRQYELTSSLKSYKNTNLSLGLKIDIGLQEKLKLYMTPSISYSFFTVPQIGIIVRDSLYELASSQGEETTSEIAFTFSGGVIYSFNEDISFVTDITLLNSTHRPEITSTAADVNGDNTSVTQKESIDFSALSISLGVIIKLSKKE